MNSKREIDKIRDGPGGMTVGDEAEGAITCLMKIDDRLYIVKQKAVYLISMADDIDPGRTNASIPNTQQLVVRAGSDSEIVQRVLLTANELFKKDRLHSHLDWNAAMLVSLEILKDLIAADEIASAYNTARSQAEEKIEQPKAMAFRLPAVPDIAARTKDFIQKTDHAFQNIYKLCTIFCDEGRMRKAGKWLDGFVNTLREQTPDDEDFIAFAEALANLGKQVRNVRNCIEHPKDLQRIELKDYLLTPDRRLVSPSIAVIQADSTMGPMPLDQFFADFLGQIVMGVENLAAFLASRNVAPMGKFTVIVGEVPEKQRRDGVRFGYMMNFGDGWNRLS